MYNSRKAFVNGKIITDGQLLENAILVIWKDKIEAILSDQNSLEGMDIIDVGGAYICPGFIDLQVMGAGGALFGGNPSVESLKIMEQELLKQGVVGFLPTVSTNTDNVIYDAIDSALDFRNLTRGTFLGLHIEGPFINFKNKGAHPAEFIREASVSELEQWLERGNGEIKMLTLAPEKQNQEVMNWLEQKDLVVAMGHTGAQYQEANTFLSGKRKAVTHLYNGMPALHHRSPGPIAAIFEKKPFTSIVADGIHVDFAMVALAKRNLNDALYLISDAATPCNVGAYQHTEHQDKYVTVDPLSKKEVLSGSKLTMLKAISNCVKFVGIDLPEAVNMATLYPAKVLGIQNSYGSIQIGREASFVILTESFEIINVIYKGEFVSK